MKNISSYITFYLFRAESRSENNALNLLAVRFYCTTVLRFPHFRSSPFSSQSAACSRSALSILASVLHTPHTHSLKSEHREQFYYHREEVEVDERTNEKNSSRKHCKTCICVVRVHKFRSVHIIPDTVVERVSLFVFVARINRNLFIFSSLSVNELELSK